MEQPTDTSPSLPFPMHVGYIVDGNRRWARQHGLPAYEGHLAGYNTLKDVVRETFNQGVRYISAYTFSTENWRRDTEEVNHIMRLIHKLITSDLKEFMENNKKVVFLGIREGLSKKILADIDKAEEATKDNDGGTLALCFNYGGYREIADAAKKCIEDDLKPEQITEEAIAERLYHPEIPPVDIVVRSSGEQRISNFMLWRSAYSELLFIDKLWPDMKKEDVRAVIEEYGRRQRRFGV